MCPGIAWWGSRVTAFKDAMRVLDGGRISIAALSLGIARGALDAAMKYATERRQFGKAISEFQAIQFKLATMATELDAAWLLTMRAAQMKDRGEKVTLESAMAKLYASEVACRICDEGVQIHGGYGFIKDYPAEKFYRDVKLCTIGEGTSEIQRMVIARELLKRVGVVRGWIPLIAEKRDEWGTELSATNGKHHAEPSTCHEVAAARAGHLVRLGQFLRC